jgi:hypothetical protein
VDDFEYSNGACGSCADCGEATSEEWHTYCSDCFAERNGWRRPNRAAIEWQNADRERVSLLTLRERVAELEQRLVTLVELAASHEQRVAALELRGSLTDRQAA